MKEVVKSKLGYIVRGILGNFLFFLKVIFDSNFIRASQISMFLSCNPQNSDDRT